MSQKMSETVQHLLQRLHRLPPYVPRADCNVNFSRATAGEIEKIYWSREPNNGDPNVVCSRSRCSGFASLPAVLW